jgi:hypothetical protein
LFHAIRVPVTAKANDHQSFLFAHNSLVDMPACVEMGEDERHPVDCDEADVGEVGVKEQSVYVDECMCFKRVV